MYKYSSIGEKIRYFRKRAGVSQTDLELEIGASFGSLSRIENGQTNPTKETLMKISKCLHLREDEIAYLFHIRDLEISEADIQNIIDVSNEMFKDIQVPAYVYDYRLRVWNWNDLALELFDITKERADTNRGIYLISLLSDPQYGIVQKFSKKHMNEFYEQQILKIKRMVEIYKNEEWINDYIGIVKNNKILSEYWNKLEINDNKQLIVGRGYLYLELGGKESVFSINNSTIYCDPRFFLNEYYILI